MRRKKKTNRAMIHVAAVAVIFAVFGGGYLLSRKLIPASAEGERADSETVISFSEAAELLEDIQDSEERQLVSSSDSQEITENKSGTKDNEPAGGNTDISDGASQISSPQENDNTAGNKNSENSGAGTGADNEPDENVLDADYKGIENPIIMLDPGHGGIDNGCELGSLLEKDLNLDISFKVKALLEEKGYTVVMTRYSDEAKVYLEERVQAAKDENATIFVSIHQNLYDGDEAEAVSGVETYYNTKNSPEGSKRLANLVQSKVTANTEARDRGVVEVNNLVVVVKNTCPAILIECGFISNTRERTLLVTDEYQDKIASGIADAIHAFFTQ